MKVSESYFDEIIDFRGQWDMPSKCGIKRVSKGERQIVVITELYQDNPGSSITSVAASLANQICERYSIKHQDLIYIECNPNMSSKLSFYDEEFYHVSFELRDGLFVNPTWKLLTKEESKSYIMI
ncbi:hypothetical protein CYCD_17320 [Tenuifilaceae bacterium CYCD]|nr:hypothetical protein CYCD_17320 [Tenuifilaceae bacterium CYCD]